ncbi:Glycoside hydrolase family 1,Glycoside hydrolase superfamily [Cinara cedri]|uniref:Glycoside hydrolase family 1,Glycoside hydrolase superfamily n=1 Tax=Cinara cedri TaxID=506608 RepID=A0A5E4MGM8_9HEMI|nr:Glycoside hydrolase family 1,Glycoside hydrolase superfamily [Cinara cedri]
MADSEVSIGRCVPSKTFPKQFLLGTATSAYQVEGAWNDDGKLPSMWDEYFHNTGENKMHKYYLDMQIPLIEEYKARGVHPRLVDEYKGMAVYEVPSSKVIDPEYFNFNGDITADTYHKIDTDVKLLKELGVQAYRFSISIMRIIPKIHDHIPEQKGIDYYNKLIDKLIENNITPMGTLFYYDASSSINVFGGLLHPHIGTLFEGYVRLCFEKFGDRVKYWTTTPDLHLAAEGYGSEHHVPGFQEHQFSGFLDYIAIKNLLIASAKAYRIYNNEFKGKQQGEISIGINGTWYYPKDPNNPEHRKIAKLAHLSTFGMIMNLLAYGEYPAEVVEAVERNSKAEGFKTGRLPEFTEEEKALVIGSFDFIVLDYYSCIKVRPLTSEELKNEPNHKRKDRGYFMEFDDISPVEVYDGFLNCLKYTNEVLNKPKIFIGGNGYPEDEGVDKSAQKIAYHTGILNKLLEALDQNINVFGYCVWSFLDTLEFTFGYRKKFGIYSVDFDDELRPRSKKNSFSFFQQLFKTNKL